MSMSKRVRKGISLLASFAMGAGLMIGTFAAPAAAVADSVTINTAGGVRYDDDYREELHGQVCDFYTTTVMTLIPPMQITVCLSMVPSQVLMRLRWNLCL